jgi:hypothetical protein
MIGNVKILPAFDAPDGERTVPRHMYLAQTGEVRQACRRNLSALYSQCCL